MNIHDILKAIDSIRNIDSAWVGPLRLQLDDLLRIWQGRYYFESQF
jgi:hypothetical protein